MEGQEASAQSEQPLDGTDIFPGRGHFTTTDQIAGDCVQGPNGELTITPVSTAPGTGGQIVEYSLVKIDSSNEVDDAMSIDVGASYKGAFVSANAKFGFSKQVKVSDTSVTMLVRVRVTNTSLTLPPGITLQPSAADLLRGPGGGAATAAQLQRFRERCGDGYVHTYYRGGQFFGHIAIQTSSKEEKQKIEASLSAKVFTFQGSTSFESFVQSVVKNSTLRVNSYSEGGQDLEPCTTVECMMDRVRTFPQQVRLHPWSYGAIVVPYTTLPMPNDATSPMDISLAQQRMDDIKTQLNDHVDLLVRYQAAQVNPYNYDFTQGTTFQQVGQAINTINGNINVLTNALRNCGDSPGTCSIPSLGVLVHEPPTLRQVYTTEAPTRVTLRPYSAPSQAMFLGRATVTGIACQPPEIVRAGPTSLSSRDAATFTIAPGILPGTVSFLSSSGRFLQEVIGPTACNGMLLPGSTRGPGEMGTFHQVPPLNGRSGYVSFRLMRSEAPSDHPYVNRSSSAYLTRTGSATSSTSNFAGIVDVRQREYTQAFQDAASWRLGVPLSP